MNNEKQTDVVIITPLLKERDAVLRHLRVADQITSKNRIYHKSVIPIDNSDESYSVVVLSLPGMGNVEAAIATSQAITVWNPSQIIVTGIAGGIRKGNDRFLGDVIVGEQIVGYELGKVTSGSVERRFQVVRPAFQLLEAARNLPPERWAFSTMIPRPDDTSGRVVPKVHFGVVASGEKVIADVALITELKSTWSRLIGVEMEGFGSALAAYEADTIPGMLMVRGICDWADSSKNDAWQEYAADVAASFTVSLLQTGPFQKQVKAQAIKSVVPSYTGKNKIKMCKWLGDDWRSLADYFDIPLHQRARFKAGFECQDIWEWLQRRNKLDGLKEALRFIDREDLVEQLS
jgi:nucleoside phosphorylase